MGKWLDLAARLEEEAATGAVRSIRSIRSNDRVDSPPNDPNGPNRTASLPEPFSRGLAALRSMPAPRMKQPEFWPIIVRDCVSLETNGWASRALALGWHPLNLWGVSEAVGGIADLEGLGVWLCGRRILLLDASSCIVADSSHSRAIFHCRPMEGATLICEFGGGGR